MVAGFHYTILFPTPDLSASSPFRGFLPFEYGWMGVELFFVISGFVILMTLRRSRGMLEFAVRRFARLWPPLIAAAALTTVTAWLIGPPEVRVSLLDFVCSVLLLDPKFVELAAPGGAKWVDPVYWSLGVEIRFYVVAAVFHAASRGRFVRYWLALQACVALASLMPLPDAAETMLTIVFFPKYMPYFTLGICVFDIWTEGGTRKSSLAGALLAAGLILADALLSLHLFAARSPLVSTIANLLIFGLFALFLIQHRSMALFSARPVVALGRASYSFYLLHNVIGLCVMRQMILAGIPYLIALPVVLGGCIAVSLFLFRWLEVPARDAILGWASKLLRAAKPSTEPAA